MRAHRTVVVAILAERDLRNLCITEGEPSCGSSRGVIFDVAVLNDTEKQR